MKKNTPLPVKITGGIAAAGMIVIIAGVIKEKTAVSVAGFAVGMVGFFASFVVSMLLDIKKTYPSRDDPFQRKMRVLRYARLIAGCTSFLSVGLMLYALYTANRMTALLNLALSLIGGGIIVSVVLSVIMAVMSNIADLRVDTNAAPPSVTAAIPHSPDPVISRILADPYVLLDERIRQIPEVQNLLQYPEVQQVFFEPTKLYTLFANDRVGELLNVVRDWIIRNNAEEIFAAAKHRRPADSPAVTVKNDKSAQSTAVKKAAAVFIVLFASIFIFFIAVVLFGAIFGSHGS